MGRTTVGGAGGGGQEEYRVYSCTPKAKSEVVNGLVYHALQLPEDIPWEKVCALSVVYYVRFTGRMMVYMDLPENFGTNGTRPETDADALKRLRETGVILSHRVQMNDDITDVYFGLVVCTP